MVVTLDNRPKARGIASRGSASTKKKDKKEAYWTSSDGSTIWNEPNGDGLDFDIDAATSSNTKSAAAARKSAPQLAQTPSENNRSLIEHKPLQTAESKSEGDSETSIKAPMQPASNFLTPTPDCNSLLDCSANQNHTLDDNNLGLIQKQEQQIEFLKEQLLFCESELKEIKMERTGATPHLVKKYSYRKKVLLASTSTRSPPPRDDIQKYKSSKVHDLECSNSSSNVSSRLMKNQTHLNDDDSGPECQGTGKSIGGSIECLSTSCNKSAQHVYNFESECESDIVASPPKKRLRFDLEPTNTTSTKKEQSNNPRQEFVENDNQIVILRQELTESKLLSTKYQKLYEELRQSADETTIKYENEISRWKLCVENDVAERDKEIERLKKIVVELHEKEEKQEYTLKEMKDQMCRTIENHARESRTCQDTFQNVLSDRDSALHQLKVEVEKLKAQTKQEKENHEDEIKKVRGMYRNEINQYESEMKRLKAFLENVQRLYKQENDRSQKLEETLSSTILEMKKEHESEVQHLSKEMNDIIIERDQMKDEMNSDDAKYQQHQPQTQQNRDLFMSLVEEHFKRELLKKDNEIKVLKENFAHEKSSIEENFKIQLFSILSNSSNVSNGLQNVLIRNEYESEKWMIINEISTKFKQLQDSHQEELKKCQEKYEEEISALKTKCDDLAKAKDYESRLRLEEGRLSKSHVLELQQLIRSLESDRNEKLKKTNVNNSETLQSDLIACNAALRESKNRIDQLERRIERRDRTIQKLRHGESPVKRHDFLEVFSKSDCERSVKTEGDDRSNDRRLTGTDSLSRIHSLHKRSPVAFSKVIENIAMSSAKKEISPLCSPLRKAQSKRSKK